MDSDRYRLQIWYGGHVQGVGFRFKAAQIAKGYDVSGFVRNLDEVREFVSELSRVMSDFIRSADEKEDKTSAKYAGFNIEL